jgi:uncharacterized membrane protein YkvA (DUF1232 family)
MTTLDSRCLDAFPNWLRSLGDDARALGAALERDDASGPAAKRAAAALNYLFKSLDLIPDGLEDLGFIDDAFVLRAAVAGVPADQLAGQAVLTRLASEAGLVKEFLGDAYARLARYVDGLEQSSARGRSVNDILSNPQVRSDFVREVKQWADGYAVPSFSRDERNLVKLKSFLLAKLPA